MFQVQAVNELKSSDEQTLITVQSYTTANVSTCLVSHQWQPWYMHNIHHECNNNKTKRQSHTQRAHYLAGWQLNI